MSLIKISSNFLVFFYSLECQYHLSIFNSLVHSACLSTSFTPIKVPLEPLLFSHGVSVEAEGEHPGPRPGVWGYSAEISHWQKVNMVGVMRLEPNWECRRGHTGLIMAQLPDSKAVFIDLAQARILQTLETESMLMKTLAGDRTPITQLASHFLSTIMEFHQLHLDIRDQNLNCSTFWLPACHVWISRKLLERPAAT